MQAWYKQTFIPQKMMRSVLLASLFPILFGTYLFGLRVLAMLAVVIIAGTATEYLFQRHYKKKVSEAVFVTCILYTLTLPAQMPIWMAAVGMIFGVFFGKMVFGGFGTNPFNPALVARAFVYVNFPEPMTITWTNISRGFPGGFATWINAPIDAVTEATPMIMFNNIGERMGTLVDSILGFVPGAIGETSAIIILLCAVYLVWKKVASWEVMVGSAVGFFVVQSVFYFLTDVEVVDPLTGFFMGGFLFATVFMATDPVSCCKTKEGKFIFGALVGLVTVFIRALSLFNGGAMFAVLIANTFGPIIDVAVRALKNRKKNKEVTA